MIDVDSPLWLRPREEREVLANVTGETRGVPWRATLGAGHSARGDLGWTSVVEIEVGRMSRGTGRFAGNDPTSATPRKAKPGALAYYFSAEQPDALALWDAIGSDVRARLRDIEATRCVVQDILSHTSGPASAYLAGLITEDRAGARRVAAGVRNLYHSHGLRDHRRAVAELLGVSPRTASYLLDEAKQRGMFEGEADTTKSPARRTTKKGAGK